MFDRRYIAIVGLVFAFIYFGLSGKSAYADPINRAPVASAQLAVLPGIPSGSDITVIRGVPTHIGINVTASSDPDGWATPVTGVSQGGKCEVNTSLNQGAFVVGSTYLNPPWPGNCNQDLGMLTFNDAPGKYKYNLVRITDASGAVSNIGTAGINIINGPTPTPTLTPIPIPRSFPDDPGSLESCSANTRVSFYYQTDAAVRNGVVPFRILLNSRNFGRVLGNPSIQSAYQFSGTQTNDSTIELSTSSSAADTFSDGYIYMGSADVVTLRFDLWCTGAQGYDYFQIVKTYTWTIPDAAASQTPSTSPTPSINPTGSPSPTPCAWWDILCTTLTPVTSPCPEGIICITPEPSPTPTPIIGIIDILNIWDDVSFGPTEIGNVLISSICNALGCVKDSTLKAIQGINPFLATTAIAAGIAASVPAIALNILPQLSRFFQFFGSFFSIHKRKTRWGIVVDSDLGRPVSRAIVQVFDAKFHQLKETQITGSDGQFGFLLPSGSYYLIASESGFLFPARKKPPTVLQKNERIYLGEEFETDEQDPDKVPHLVVPMDREVASPVAQMIFWRFAEHALALVDGIGFGFLIVGAAINTFFLLTVPGRMNIFFEVLYLLLFALKLYILLSHQKGLGTVVDGATGSPVDLAIIRLYETNTNRIVQTRVTNVHGKFFLLVPRGMYTAAVAKAGYTTITEANLKISGNTSKALALDFKLVVSE